MPSPTDDPLAAAPVDPTDDAARIARAAAEIPDPDAALRLAETFQVLADPGRVRIILALHSAGELRVGALASVTGLSETACSHSLRLLRSARVVRFRKVGRSVYYALDDDHVRTLLEVARDHVLHRDPAAPELG
ncbi:MAG: metalloregulator ArsR/SmtB family transcription factor [Patulibacter sp.]